MWRKTVIRRICKYLPLTPKTTAVLEHDIQSDFGSGITINKYDVDNVATQDNTVEINNVIDVKATEPDPKPKRKSKVKDLVERAKVNDLPEPEEDFTS
jgi:hypothetical protein